MRIYTSEILKQGTEATLVWKQRTVAECQNGLLDKIAVKMIDN